MADPIRINVFEVYYPPDVTGWIFGYVFIIVPLRHPDDAKVPRGAVDCTVNDDFYDFYFFVFPLVSDFDGTYASHVCAAE